MTAPAEALDERRLAGAVVADDAQHLARVELEVGVVERDDASVRLDQADGLQDRAVGRSCSGHFADPP